MASLLTSFAGYFLPPEVSWVLLHYKLTFLKKRTRDFAQSMLILFVSNVIPGLKKKIPCHFDVGYWTSPIVTIQIKKLTCHLLSPPIFLSPVVVKVSGLTFIFFHSG